MAARHHEDTGIVFQNDAEAASFAAALLDVSEFRLFEIAHEDWFGRKATRKATEAFFVGYLKSGLIPFWLRNTVRTIICKYQQGNLAPGKFGFDQTLESPSRRRVGWILMGLLYLLVFAIVWGFAMLKSY